MSRLHAESNANPMPGFLSRLISTVQLRFWKLRRVRSYIDYQEYVKHQAEKSSDPVRRERWLGSEWEPKLQFFRQTFERILTCERLDIRTLRGLRGLCLGARTGQEVQALADLGVYATGIDLVPCEPLVVEGDVHDLSFADDSFDFVFSNIFDHVMRPDQFVGEIKRVTKPGGLVLLHLAIGKETDPYGVIELDSSSVVVKLFGGAEIVLDHPMVSWGGLNWELLVRITD